MGQKRQSFWFPAFNTCKTISGIVIHWKCRESLSSWGVYLSQLIWEICCLRQVYKVEESELQNWSQGKWQSMWTGLWCQQLDLCGVPKHPQGIGWKKSSVYQVCFYVTGQLITVFTFRNLIFSGLCVECRVHSVFFSFYIRIYIC